MLRTERPGGEMLSCGRVCDPRPRLETANCALHSPPMRFTRREFLRAAAAAGALTAGCATPPKSPSTARAQVGTQLFGWRQYYQREGKKLADHFPEVLSAVRD